MEKSRKRYLHDEVEEDLSTKMVFVGGPRQVGKTTFALSFLAHGTKKHPAYLNWDILAHKAAIRRSEIPPHEPLIILDEIHKYARWRNLLKGLFDQYSPEIRILVTGSARLDHYRRGGDSLHGRYHYYRLHPFSLRELNASPTANDVKHLLTLGGFPEPCLSGSEKTLRRWQHERMDRVLREDLRDLERVREVSLIELLLDALPGRVGSPLSIKSLREDLEVAHATVARWIEILERLYVCFRISPYGAPKIRAVKKEQKIYFWDWTQVSEEGPRFENLVACQLLKYCHHLEDTQGFKMELRFLRDTDKREVDFVVLRDGKPLFAVECKTGERNVSTSARYFRDRTKIPAWYQIHLGKIDHGHATRDIRVLPFQQFCMELAMP